LTWWLQLISDAPPAFEGRKEGGKEGRTEGRKVRNEERRSGDDVVVMA
jgi:hypothetical protein